MYPLPSLPRTLARRIPAALLALAITVAALPARAAFRDTQSNPLDPGRSPLASLPAVVHAGQTIEVRWTDLPREFEEMELVLALDGREFDLRISAELDPRAEVFRWTVPNVAAEGARIAIRAGRERERSKHGEPDRERAGSHEQEVWFPASAPFRIVENTRAPRTVFALREGAAWEQTDVDIGSRTHSTWRAPRAELHRAENAGCAETAPRSPECAAPVAASLIPQEFITSARPLARSSPSRAQRCSPLRN